MNGFNASLMKWDPMICHHNFGLPWREWLSLFDNPIICAESQVFNGGTDKCEQLRFNPPKYRPKSLADTC